MMLASGLAMAVAQMAAVPAPSDVASPGQAVQAAPIAAPMAQTDAQASTDDPKPTLILSSGFDISTVQPGATRWDAALAAPPGDTSAVSGSDAAVSGSNSDARMPVILAIPAKNYRFSTLIDHAVSSPWEVGGVFALITGLGVFNWDWGSASFHFHSEGWFGRNTSSMGMDKLGHAYSTYLITELFTTSIRRNARNPAGNAVSAAILAMGMMTYVEIFDGISKEHGFSWEDMVADAAGTAFSLLRSHLPGMRDKLDFRLQYIPSGNISGFHPITDYSGQRYVIALQLGGFSQFRNSPLRFVELQVGYMARGFTAEEKANGEKLRRVPFVGVGLNLQQLLFPHPKARWQRFGRGFLDYVQVPYTAIYSDQFEKN